MPTETEARLARYSETAMEADAWGRLISVRRLKPSEQTKLTGMTPELSGYDDARNDDGEMVKVPQRWPLVVCASVCSIDSVNIPFPRTRGELDAIWDRLDVEGLAAAIKASAKLNPPATPGEKKPDYKDDAKNS